MAHPYGIGVRCPRKSPKSVGVKRQDIPPQQK
jgi:hypothetical protein